MEWLKLYSKGILRGSLSQSDDTTQLVWVKLLAMANETRDRDGYLRYSVGVPYSWEFIAMTCGVTLDELTEAIAVFESDIRDGMARIGFGDDGSIFITNWEEYQGQVESKKKLSARELELIERKKLHQLAGKYPVEAMGVPEVRKEIDSHLKGAK